MAVSDNIVKVLTEFGKQTVPDIRVSLKKKLYENAAKSKSRISRSESNLAPSIKFEFPEKGDKLTFVISMHEYGMALDGGRVADKVSSSSTKRTDDLIDWANAYGRAESYRIKDLATRLAKQGKSKIKNKKPLKKMPFDNAAKVVAYMVSMKLKKHGFDGNNFFKEVMKDGRLEQLETKLKEVIKTDIKIELSNTFK